MGAASFSINQNSSLFTWNTGSQIVTVSLGAVALLAAVMGVALYILEYSFPLSVKLMAGGGAAIILDVGYLIILVKNHLNEQEKQYDAGIEAYQQFSGGKTEDVIAKDQIATRSPSDEAMDDEAKKDLFFALLTDSPDERAEALTQINSLPIKTPLEQAKETIYSLFRNPNTEFKKIIEYLLKVEPDFAPHIKSFQSNQIFKKIFNLASDELQRQNVVLFVCLFKALSNEYQLQLLKVVVLDPKFKTIRVEIIQKTEAALLHPFSLLEYLSTDKTSFAQVLNPLLPNLPALSIISLFWRVAAKAKAWEPFQPTLDETAFIMSLTFSQIRLLHKYHSQVNPQACTYKKPFVTLWSLQTQPYEVISRTCFDELARGEKDVCVKNQEDFLAYLTFKQLSSLIQADSQLVELLQIFGNTETKEYFSKKTLKGFNSVMFMVIPK